MKTILSLLLICICLIGCQQTTQAPRPQSQPKLPKTLDWNLSASDQNLKVGETLVVEGIAYNIYPYEYEHRIVARNGIVKRVGHLKRPITLPPEHVIMLLNPDQPDVKKNPNVSIGGVACKIYNASYNNEYLGWKETAGFYDMYPSKINLEDEGFALMYGKWENRDNRI